MANEKCYTEINGNPAYQDTGEENLKATALRFIHKRCKNLGFDDELSRSGEEGAVPYNQARDTDRLCLENAVFRFLESGSSQDAFDVYVCYIEMFLESYGSSRHLIEMLSEFEVNGSSLLMKHRDHYAHSVYVFCLGLAVYESNESYQRAYRDYYASKNCFGDAMNQCVLVDEETSAAHNFLKYWGLTALFHDIGYPFELPYEQVSGYFESNRNMNKRKDQSIRNNRPFMAYHNIERFTALTKEQRKDFKKLYQLKEDAPDFATTDELFAYDLYEKLGKAYRFTPGSMVRELHTKPACPDLHDYFMDHAYFSATVLFRKLAEIIELGNGEQNGTHPNQFTRQHMDALTAILMHNSLFKFSIFYYKAEIRKPLKKELHPLAYLLMLCDELQCWDRTSYGRDSRTQVHPYDCELSFRDEEIEARYIFDSRDQTAIKKYNRDINAFRKGERKKKPKLKSYSDFYQYEEQKCGFTDELQDILDFEGIGSIIVHADMEKKDNQRKRVYLSDSNFIHLYDFAVALNYRYSSSVQEEKKKMSKNGKLDEKDLDELVERIIPSLKSGQDEKESPCYREFDQLSLEYKLSNINQAKEFAKYLNMVGGLYSDRPLNLVPFERFSEDDMKRIGLQEHLRWLAEHEEMGWKYGEKRDNVKRLHPDFVPEQMMNGKTQIDVEIAKDNYIRLDKEEQAKDTEPFNLLIKLLPGFEGVRFYRIPGQEEN